MTFNKSNVIVSGSRSSLSEYANYTTVYPKPAMVGGKIVLTQDMINKQNVKYIIKWNFDLDDETITVPEGCLIEFDGGSFSNGTLVGNETILVYNQEEEDVFKNVSLEGSFERSTSAIADKMDNTNGMAKIYLKKNKPLATQLTQPNTIYVIQYDFTLTGDVTIPANCVLEFDGGSIKNATGNSYIISGNHTVFNFDVAYNIFNDTLGDGFDLPYIDIKWVGAISDFNESTKLGTDNAFAFERAINCIGQYYNGLYIKLIGQYYIGTPISTIYDLNIWGSHFNSRNMLGVTEVSDISSPSLIAIGDINAFNLVGRGSSAKFCNFNLKNLKVVGTQSQTGVFINYTASGAPSRVSIIEECEFTSLDIVFKSITSGNTVLGDCTIQKCVASSNGKFVKVDSTSNESTVCNFVIRDSNIEQNDSACIELKSIFGNVIIDNNLLEGQNNTIDISIRLGSVDIVRNYFEQNLGDYLISVRGTSQGEAHLRFCDNFILDSSNIYKLYGGLIIDEFDQFGNIGQGSYINACYINCDYSLLDLSKLGTCVLQINPDVINTIKPFTTNISFNEVLKGKYLVKNDVDWSGYYTETGDVYFNYVFTCFKGTNGTFMIGFYNDDGNNGMVIYPSNDFPLVLVRLKPYNNQTSTLIFGQPYGGDTKYSAPIPIKNINQIFCPTVYAKSTGTRPNISVGTLPKGFEHFDTKPTYWNGTAWVDATGTPV